MVGMAVRPAKGWGEVVIRDVPYLRSLQNNFSWRRRYAAAIRLFVSAENRKESSRYGVIFCSLLIEPIGTRRPLKCVDFRERPPAKAGGFRLRLGGDPWSRLPAASAPTSEGRQRLDHAIYVDEDAAISAHRQAATNALLHLLIAHRHDHDLALSSGVSHL